MQLIIHYTTKIEESNLSFLIFLLNKLLSNKIIESKLINLINITTKIITNNVAIAYKLLHSMKSRRRGKLGHMVIKHDMSKIYD